MSNGPGRFSQLRWLQTIAAVLGLIGGGALIGLGLTGYAENAQAWMIAAGGFVIFLVVIVMTVAPLLIKIEATQSRLLGEIRDLNDAVSNESRKLEAIVENTRISDAAKSLARRDEELEALRAAIRNDIRTERWAAALSLIDEIEQRFGFAEEAEQLREEVDDARSDRIQNKLTEAIEIVEGYFARYEWDRAKAEIERLTRALPNDQRAASMFDRMKELREKHKRELLVDWEEAVRRADTDHAIEVLKELDMYLTPQEAQNLADAARSVFKEKLIQLGIQFRFAVKERRWNDALDIGIEIMRDYPNSKMASEVREAMDRLRELAEARAEREAETGAA